MSKFEYTGVDAHVEGIGLVRECIGCEALIAHGPTRCVRCAKEGDPERGGYVYMRAIVGTAIGGVIGFVVAIVLMMLFGG